MTTTTPAEPDEQLLEEPTPSEPASRATRWFTRIAARPGLVVSASATAAAAWAIIGSRAVFPFLSNDHDEAVYLLQANAIEHGHLFPRAPADPAAFLPWLTAQEGNHYVPKYAPVFPAMLAFGRWVFGTERATLALIAAGVIVMTYVLATEILDDHRQAALASIFMLLTPLFIVQSTTFLPYTASLLLLISFAFALLRGLRRARARWLVLAGSLLGFAFFARPYDALLFMLPLSVYVVARYRHELRTLAHRAGWVIVGLVPPAIAMAAFDQAATGSAIRSPFSLIDSRDTIGFGARSLDPSNPAVKYTPSLGVTGLTRHAMLTGFWCFGGLVLIGCAVIFLSRRHWRGSALALASIAIVLPVGYLFFWGTYGAAVWGAPWYLGPYYYMPIFAPIAILGAGGFTYFVRENRRVAVLALAGMLALSAFVTGQAIAKNLRFTQDDRHLNTAITSTHAHNALIFLPTSRVLHPFATARNSWDVSGDVIYAVDRGAAANAALAADFSARAPYVVVVSGQLRASPPDPHLTSSLHPLTLVRGHTIVATIDFGSPVADRVLALTVTANDRVDTYVIDAHPQRGTRERLEVQVTPTTTSISGRVLSHGSTRTTPSSELELKLTSARGSEATPTSLYDSGPLGMVQRGDALAVLVPAAEASGGSDRDPLTITAR